MQLLCHGAAAHHAFSQLTRPAPVGRQRSDPATLRASAHAPCCARRLAAMRLPLLARSSTAILPRPLAGSCAPQRWRAVASFGAAQRSSDPRRAPSSGALLRGAAGGEQLGRGVGGAHVAEVGAQAGAVDVEARAGMRWLPAGACFGAAQRSSDPPPRPQFMRPAARGGRRRAARPRHRRRACCGTRGAGRRGRCRHARGHEVLATRCLSWRGAAHRRPPPRPELTRPAARGGRRRAARARRRRRACGRSRRRPARSMFARAGVKYSPAGA